MELRHNPANIAVLPGTVSKNHLDQKVFERKVFGRSVDAVGEERPKLQTLLSNFKPSYITQH